jgi:hypothetical protein
MVKVLMLEDQDRVHEYDSYSHTHPHRDGYINLDELLAGTLILLRAVVLLIHSTLRTIGADFGDKALKLSPTMSASSASSMNASSTQFTTTPVRHRVCSWLA